MAVTKIRGNTQIIDGSILNAQINASAAIAESKLSLDFGTSTLNTAISNHTSDSNNPHSVDKADVLTGDLIVNADVDAGAAIAYSKLSLTGAVLNADLAGSIAYGKLSLTGAILNADLAGSIVYSKLSLTGAILNADLAGSIALSKLAEAVIQADGGQAFTADQAMGSNKLTGLTAGTAAGDAVNKSQLDGIAAGLSWKDKVRWASDALIADLSDVTVADPDGQGQGITLIEGDRILVKDTASINGVEGEDAKRNGIYIVGVVDTGKAPVTRTTDADTAAEVESAAVFVDEGTSANEAFVQTADNVTLETTALVFVQFTGLGNITAGTGLTKSGNTINFVATDASILVVADSAKVQLDATAATIALGGAGVQIADGTAGQILIGKGGGSDTAFTAISGDITLGSDGTVAIASGVIVNADVKSDAAIAYSKLASLSDGNILVGSAGNVATSVNPSGDVDISNAGVFSIASDVIVDADVKSDAAIAYSKLNLTGAVLNADLAGSIAYGKLSLTGAILNADLAGSIAYGKLSLTGAILNADLAGSIAHSKLAALASTKFLVGNGSNVATEVAMSGDATLSNAGVLSLASDVLKDGAIVTREVPAGDLDGADVTYVLANTPIAGTEHVYLNGILQNEGVANDYQISSATITFNSAPLSGDVVLCSYHK